MEVVESFLVVWGVANMLICMMKKRIVSSWWILPGPPDQCTLEDASCEISALQEGDKISEILSLSHLREAR